MTEERPTRRRGLVLGGLGAVVVVAAIAAALSIGGDTPASRPGAEAPAGPVARPCPPHTGTAAPSVEGRAALDQPVPAFTAETVDGCVVSVADFAGRPLVLAFGASWCAPCREEWPALIAERTARDASFDVLTVAFDDLPSDSRRFLDEVGAPWQTVADPDGRLARAFRVSTVPTTFYVDADGIVRQRIFGGDPDDIRAALDRIVPAPPGA